MGIVVIVLSKASPQFLLFDVPEKEMFSARSSEQAYKSLSCAPRISYTQYMFR